MNVFGDEMNIMYRHRYGWMKERRMHIIIIEIIREYECLCPYTCLDWTHLIGCRKMFGLSWKIFLHILTFGLNSLDYLYIV